MPQLAPLPLAIVALAAVVLIVVIAAYRMLLPSGNPVELPKFAGMAYSDAEGVAARAHVSLHVVTRRPDERAAKDVIVGQFPSAGGHVREGRIVDVIVSDGPPVATVPNLSNMSQRDATVALGNARLELGVVTHEKTMTTAAGRISNQHPDAFAAVPAGTKVDITVAEGRPEAYVPNFVGLTLAFSQSAAKQAGVVLGTPLLLPITKGSKPKGVVIAQDPLPGQPLSGSDKIVLQVSGGPPPTPTPLPTFPPTQAPPPPPSLVPASESPSPSASASPPPATTAATRSLRIAVQLPSSKTPKRVRVALVDASGSHDLYDQSTAGGFTLSFDVNVTGAGTVQTYVDGQLVTSTQL